MGPPTNIMTFRLGLTHLTFDLDQCYHWPWPMTLDLEHYGCWDMIFGLVTFGPVIFGPDRQTNRKRCIWARIRTGGLKNHLPFQNVGGRKIETRMDFNIWTFGLDPHDLSFTSSSGLRNLTFIIEWGDRVEINQNIATFVCWSSTSLREVKIFYVSRWHIWWSIIFPTNCPFVCQSPKKTEPVNRRPSYLAWW